VIFEYFFKQRTLKDIAKSLFVTAPRIGVIREKALDKLRKSEPMKMMARFNIPRAEEWLSKSKLYDLRSKDYYIPKKPEWVKVEYNEGVPRLFAPRNRVLQTRPITQQVYKVWLEQAIAADETHIRREAASEGTSSFK